MGAGYEAVRKRQWYASCKFEPSPTDAYPLYLLIKDIKVLLVG